MTKGDALRDVLSRASLPALSLAASYGVYSFSSRFVPDIVAVFTSAAFELVYIGLAVARDLTPEQRQRARRISAGAVAVSVAFNVTSGTLDSNPGFWEQLPLFAKFLLALLHGVPLAILAYQVSDLLFHSSTGGDIRKLYETAINKLQELTSRLETVEQDNNALRVERDDLTSRLQEVSQDLQLLQEDNKGFVISLAQLQTSRDQLQDLVNQLQTAAGPFVFVEGQFKELPAPVANRRVDLFEPLAILGGCLQARKVTPDGEQLTGRAKGSNFGKSDYDQEVRRLLENDSNI